MADLSWSDAQWQKVNDAVNEAFGKASVASAFLPMYGPLSGSTETVRNERLVEDDSDQPPIVFLDTDHDAVNLKLVNLTVRVLLSSEQIADETLSNALLAFRRAANILAQEEDRIVFAGFLPRFSERGFDLCRESGSDRKRGLADLPAKRGFTPLKGGDGAPLDCRGIGRLLGRPSSQRSSMRFIVSRMSRIPPPLPAS